MPLRGQVFFAAMAMNFFQKTTLPTRKNKLQLLILLQCPILPCTSLNTTSSWNVDILDILGGWSFWSSAGTMFWTKTLPGMDRLQSIMDFLLMLFLKGPPFGPKGHPVELAKFELKSTTQIVSKLMIGRLSFEDLNVPNPWNHSINKWSRKIAK